MKDGGEGGRTEETPSVRLPDPKLCDCHHPDIGRQREGWWVGDGNVVSDKRVGDRGNSVKSGESSHERKDDNRNGRNDEVRRGRTHLDLVSFFCPHCPGLKLSFQVRVKETTTDVGGRPSDGDENREGTP